MKEYFFPGKGMLEDPVFCPKCGKSPRWKEFTEDGIECLRCSVIGYNEEPVARPARHGQEPWTSALRRARY